MAHAINPPLPGPSGHLTRKHFAWACAAALTLHAVAFAAWMLSPKEQVDEIPVRILNIKLGDGEEVELFNAPRPANAAPVEQALAKHLNAPVSAPPAVPTLPPPSPSTVQLPAANAKPGDAATRNAQQFVRPQNFDYKGLNAVPAASPSSPLGNSTAAKAEAIRRYEQLVSSWYWKFHFYPEQARQQRLQSKGTVRVEYDRRGNLRSYVVEQPTGYMILDRAMLEIANRANPFPPVPDEYKPDSPVVAFTIQVTFTLNDTPATPPAPAPAP